MKYFITSMLLSMMCFAKGQVVNIPDNNFKNALLGAGVDINTDGEIQNSEAEAIIDLLISSPGAGIMDYTGIGAFINMKKCKITGTITGAGLDVSNLAMLEKLEARNLGLSFLNVTGCSSLKELRIYRNNFAAMDISTCSNLEIAEMSLNTSLQTLNIGNIAKLTWLDVGNDPHLISSLDLTRCDSLQYLFLQNSSNIDTVNISGLTKITHLDAFAIQNLVARNCTGLKTVNYQITIPASISNSADFTGCINLEQLVLTNLNATSLDLSTCIKLIKLTLYNCGEGFQNLNIKNGSVTILDNRMVLSRPLNVCADDFEVDTLRQMFPAGSNPLLPSINLSPYCTFYPGGNFNTITGTIRADVNNNGCDINDSSISHVPIKMADALGNSFMKYTAANGSYTHYPYTGIFTLTSYFPYPYFIVTPASASASFDTANSLTATRDFCIQPNGIHNDLEVIFLPVRSAAGMGSNNVYTLVYKNRGTTTLSGNISVDFDDSKMNFVSASENISSQNTGQLLWNYNNFQPLESRTINVTFNLLPPPVNNIGDTLLYLAAITPSANDETAFDNSFVLPQLIRGSFDPNEKECIEGSKLDISKISDYLHYQIHFQNEGTDTAFNIVLADTLSSNLDWNTFEFIGSSHTCNPVLKNNKAEFFFENINLPYKAIDEPGSNGWVAFKIKPKPSVVIGDSINNTAAIYFDFNMPVITNKAITIVTSSSMPVPVKLEYFSVNKKNNSNLLNWKASCTYNATFVIERSSDGIHFSSIGNINATSLRCQLPFNFTDNSPIGGKNYYRLKITDADGISFYSKTIVAGNNKAGLEITAVTNNIVYLNSNKQQTITMKVIAADGKELVNQKQNVSAGNNNISLLMKNTAKGIYTLIVYTNESEIITRKFIHQ